PSRPPGRQQRIIRCILLEVSPEIINQWVCHIEPPTATTDAEVCDRLHREKKMNRLQTGTVSYHRKIIRR
ncbi:unnamed protein product, partial [Mycena citricolor]